MRLKSFFTTFVIIHFTITGVFAQFSPATFSGSVFTPAQTDMSVLQQSMKQNEERQKTAYEEYNKLQIFLSEYQKQLNNDEKTLQWFAEFQKKKLSPIESFMRIGDYGNAIKYAILYRGKIANDPELIARLQTTKEYQEKVKAIMMNTYMDPQQKEDWIRNNPYYFIPIMNTDGTVIGGKLGTKDELEAFEKEKEKEKRMQKEKERMQEMEKERMQKLQIEENKKRLYAMTHPFDNFDYSNYEKVIDHPKCKSSYKDIVITKVAISASETRIEFELTYTPFIPCNYGFETYIKASGTKKLKWTKHYNAPSKLKFKSYYETIKFALSFPPLPKNTKSFSLIDPAKKGWKFINIKID